jgi:hypothetical protein
VLHTISKNLNNKTKYMNKVIHLIIVIAFISVISSCNSSEKNNTSTTTTSATEKDEVAKQGETAIENAGAAKRPKGTITFKINGETFSANENTVQCMFVGMGSKDMAQGMISGNGTGFSISGIMMTKPQLGELKAKGITSATGLSIIKDGVQYNMGMKGEAIINITKINKDGNNHYIAGTFNGTLSSQDGKTITVTDGEFASAYL